MALDFLGLQTEVYARGFEKLDWDKVRFIRTSALSNKALAELLGVSSPLICNVRAGRAWVEATRWP